ncbi:MAG: hypothetical protein ACJ746_22215 [Bryobacteraceae bacterium]
MNRRTFLQGAGAAWAASPFLTSGAIPGEFNLATSVIVGADNATLREKKALAALSEEIEKRSQLRVPVQTAKTSKPAEFTIYAGTRQSARTLGSRAAAAISPAASLASDGYSISSGQDANGRWISIIGADERGLLFGVGKVLRNGVFGREKATLNVEHVTGSTSPKYPLRGHQLGYRPKTNAYDAWDVPIWDQYIRDLAMFGTNAIELIPPRSDDEPDSPHFPLSPERMMIEMSRICDEYGLDVWIWYPAMDPDYADPATVESALKEWEHFYQVLPRIDALFVPGGDPGHTEPRAMLAFLEKQKASLRRYHPKAQMWMSPQGFREAWMNDFFHIIEDSHTATWLDGLVFGPQSRMSLPQLRQRVPKTYPIRFYPDITHSVQCQYPVPDWDIAFAHTEGREVINPRPVDQANILRRYSPDTNGFITYSEGCNDDVNKFVWSALGWNPDAHVAEVLRDFSRYFFGQPFAEGFGQGLLDLEINWRGPLATNDSVPVTLSRFRDVEAKAPPAVLQNWRFQQGLYRAYYDASLRSRLLDENSAVQKAHDILGRAAEIGWAPEPLDISQRLSPAPANGLDPVILLDEAERVLSRALFEPAGAALRTRVRELGEALFQTIRMQLAVDRYQGEAVNRAANLETLESPISDVSWLRVQIAAIRKLGSANEQVAAIRQLLARKDPGPGGFYDEPGNPSNRPRVLLGAGYKEDPEFRASVLTGFSYPDRLGSSAPIAWKRWGESLFDAPLRMQYKDLDPESQYRIRVVYSPEAKQVKIRLVANEKHEVHPLLQRPSPQKPLEFDIAQEATKGGELTLSWAREQGLGGNGRGCQVCEVWLLRKANA